jgi:hypothetical protein
LVVVSRVFPLVLLLVLLFCLIVQAWHFLCIALGLIKFCNFKKTCVSLPVSLIRFPVCRCWCFVVLFVTQFHFPTVVLISFFVSFLFHFSVSVCIYVFLFVTNGGCFIVFSLPVDAASMGVRIFCWGLRFLLVGHVFGP